MVIAPCNLTNRAVKSELAVVQPYTERIHVGRHIASWYSPCGTCCAQEDLSVLFFFRLLSWATPPLLSFDLSSLLSIEGDFFTYDRLYTLSRSTHALSSVALQSLFIAQQ